MNFIRELFEGNQEQEWIHNKFIRYGKGEFAGPYISLKKSGDSLRISSSADYVNMLGRLISENFPGPLKVDGSIRCREKVDSYLEAVDLEIVKAKKKKGVFSYKVKGEVDSKALAELYVKLKDGILLLSISGEGVNLKMKKKPPKPGSKQDRKFCTGKVAFSKNLLDEICFDTDAKDSKEVEVSHTYRIDELVAPEDCKDFSQARILARRKGSVRRSVKLDNSTNESENSLFV